MSETRKIGRALISLSDKTGAVEFAQELVKFGAEIISTGGTAAAFRNAGIEVTEVSDITGFPEMMDGRVKTLHPKIHGALLALRDDESHLSAMKTHGITPIDMVVINLYPFEATIEKDGITLAEAIENIDIGGPAMIRSASKNWRDVAVVTDPALYPDIVEELNSSNGSLSLETRQKLATIAFTRTAGYDNAISDYLAKQLLANETDSVDHGSPIGGQDSVRSQTSGTATSAAISAAVQTSAAAAAIVAAVEAEPSVTLPASLNMQLAKVTDLRYGENPHQQAALYRTAGTGGIAGAVQLHGKEMSYNNYVDAEAAWDLVCDLDDLAVAIIKHTNPSGVGIGSTNEEAYRRALATDPVSAFGGIVAFNSTVDAGVAKLAAEIFTEVIIAPGFDPHAVEIFSSKKNLRLLEVKKEQRNEPLEYKQISGGVLIQTPDMHKLDRSDLKIVSELAPTEDQIEAMLFAWTVCKHVKSNAIVIADRTRTIGVGSGQMNRVDSLRIAAMRAERFDLPIAGSALASDAFFPFRDNVDEAAKLGVSAIIQPGGSIKDEESIAAANEHGITMAFTGTRHFKH